MTTGYVLEDGAPCPVRLDPDLVRLDLARLMRSHKVTIRALAKRMRVSMARVREVRGLGRVPYLVYCDYVEAVTGASVFSRARHDAILRERARRAELRPEPASRN